MRSRKRQRLWLVSLAAILLGGAAALAVTAFEENIVFFRSPSDIAEGKAEIGRLIRIGGLVEEGSVKRTAGSSEISFSLTDGGASVPVIYNGILPDLFREAQGVVAQGRLQTDGSFLAVEVLAKHDESYMPPEVAEALKKSGYWQENNAEEGMKGHTK